ncbi:PAS-domain containing protein [Acuticoccus sp. MNP-M23]|uniref:hybrid sensor histidine kinase/response regulator n=1 Tax=Acuticoccus sp. MNP-M23 TaxID=3072793 RepID=UPI0028163480|nr:PAS-domain containing protein [Acuticoccus sp. MNP-M23]WMS43464.1 PAS-domain containing protein [Acuticoccus sp. MNP-M23]
MTTGPVSRPAPQPGAARPTVEMLSEAIHALDQAVVLFDAAERFVFANEAWYAMFYAAGPRPPLGISAAAMNAELVDDGFFHLAEGVDPDDCKAAALAAMRAYDSEFSLDLADGRHLTAAAKRTAGGGYLISFHDVTARVRGERLFADAIARLPVALAVEDAAGRLTHLNAAFADICGLPEDTLRAMDLEARIRAILPRLIEIDGVPLSRAPASAQHQAEAAIHRALAVPVEARLADGRAILLERAAIGEGGEVAVITDITATKAGETTRLEAFTDAVQTLSTGIALFDADFRFILGNERYFEMWFPPDGIPRPVAGEPFEALITRLIAAGEFLVPDGLTAETYIDALIFESRAYSTDHLVTTPRFTLSASSLKSRLGGVLLEFADVTQQLKTAAELENQRELAHQSEKLSALGELLAGVAHELNNPLSIVFGYAQMLEARVTDPEHREWLELLSQAAERAARIVRMFLAMARQRPQRIEKCAVGDIVAAALDVSGYGLRTSGTAITFDLGEDLPPVAADADQLTQVLSNLVVNAAHVLEPMGRGGRFHITTRASGERVTIEVCDNGPGIPKEIQRRVFEPFFTTKEVGVGTGVGLAFSHRIVESHGGTLTFSSGPDGTTFRIVLPAAPSTAAAALPEDHGTPVASRTVLVIDDEVAITRLLTDVLGAHGHRVTATADPRHGLRLLATRRFDAVLCDVRMPGMNGLEFLSALRRIAPAAAGRLGFITGDALGVSVAEGLAASGRPHIEKPIMVDELLALLETLARTQETVR